MKVEERNNKQVMSNPKICLRCKEILTFCECENCITDKDEYIEYLETELKKEFKEGYEAAIKDYNIYD